MMTTLFIFLLVDALGALVPLFFIMVVPQFLGAPMPPKGYWLPVTRRSLDHNELTAHRRRLTRLHERGRELESLSVSYENEGLVGHVEVLAHEIGACQKKIKEEAETIQRLKKQQRERRFREHTSGPKRLGS